MLPVLRGSTAPLAGQATPQNTIQNVSHASTQVGDLVLVISWQGLNSAAGSSFTLIPNQGYTELVNYFHDDGANDGTLGIAWKLATQAGAQSYQAFTTTSPNTDCRTAIRVYAAGTFSLDDQVLAAATLTKLSADLALAVQGFGAVQVMGTSPSIENIAESGIHGPVLSNGETLRFGKIVDPVDPSRNAFLFQVASTDPSTSGGKRVEFKIDNNIDFGSTYWVAFSIYIYDWGTLSTEGTGNTSLWGCQVHTGSAEEVGGPSFGLYTRNSGRDFRVQARTSFGPDWGNNDVVTTSPVLPIPFGQWTDFILKFKHSRTNNGLLQCWMNGTQIFDYTGNLGYDTGFVDYAKFGYYNFVAAMMPAPRKVLQRNPSIVLDPTGSTYTLPQIQALLSPVTGLRTSMPVTGTDGSIPPDATAVSGLNTTREYLIENIGGWWCANGTIDTIPGTPVSSFPSHPYTNAISTAAAGWLELAVAHRQFGDGVGVHAATFDPEPWTDNVSGTQCLGTVACAVAIPGSVRRGIVGWAEFTVPDANARRGLIGWAELEVPEGDFRRGIIGWANLQVPDYGFPGQISYLFHSFWSQYRYTATNLPSTSTRRGRIGWANLEVPDATRRGRIGWVELTVPSSSAPPPEPLKTGRYSAQSGSLTRNDSWEAWLGREQDIVLQFTKPTTWGAIPTMAGHFYPWVPWLNADTNREIVISVSMAPFDGTKEGNLLSVANGTRDAQWVAFGRNLYDNGLAGSRVHLRIGWEMDGNWYPWASRPSFPSNRDNFAKAVWRIYNKMQEGANEGVRTGAQWKVSLCVTNFSAQWGTSWLNTIWGTGTANDLTPLIHHLGNDFYDFSWSLSGDTINDSMSEATKTSRRAQMWTKHLADFTSFKNFCASKGKPMALHEWGVTYYIEGGLQRGGTDNPAFIQNIYNLINSENFIFDSYLDNDNSANAKFKISPASVYGVNSSFPSAQAKYKALWGG